MNFRIFRLFKSSEKELRFIDQVSMFYFLYVIMYTIGDFKNSYPIYLIVIGIIFHLLTLLTFRQVNHVIFEKNGDFRRPNYFKGYTNLLYKIVPIGLSVTYTLNIIYGFNGSIGIYGYILFLWITLPVILFLVVLGYSKKKFLHYFRLKIPAINYTFIGGVILLLILTSRN